MTNTNLIEHWEEIYRTRQLNEVSWFQPVPRSSLFFVNHAGLPPDAKIIDIGGGDSFFVDNLLDLGYTDISVLDISGGALARARQRLGARAGMVKWIVSDAVSFQGYEKYDFWHDRAAFHFLTGEEERHRYIETARKHIVPGGFLVIGAFSESGPKKCSGLEVRQYSEQTMSGLLSGYFEKSTCHAVDHMTPSGTVQNFIFCCFKKSIIP